MYPSIGYLVVAQMGKNPPAVGETWVRSLVWEDPLEEGMAIHSSILAWRIPMDRGAWQATVHGVTMSQTWLSDKKTDNSNMAPCMSSYMVIICLLVYLPFWTWTQNPETRCILCLSETELSPGPNWLQNLEFFTLLHTELSVWSWWIRRWKFKEG